MTDINEDNPFHGFSPSLPSDAPDWAHVMHGNISMVYKSQVRTEKKHQKILDIVEEVKPTVLDVVEGLAKNPMFKMLLGGKK